MMLVFFPLNGFTNLDETASVAMDSAYYRIAQNLEARCTVELGRF